MDVEADFLEVEPEEIDLHRIVAEFSFDLGVLDAGVDLFEGLGVDLNAEAAKNAERENQKRELCEQSAVETFLPHNQVVIGLRSCHLPTQAVQPSVPIY